MKSKGTPPAPAETAHTGDLFAGLEAPAEEGGDLAPPAMERSAQGADATSGSSGESPVLDLGRFVERSYLEYAMSVVMGRALPDLADGQKPVQRRILFAMHELGLYQPARHVKSARVVGDVIGKYHPHGDSAAYEALVRQAQDFTLRYPLIDGQGNFGSRDGDGAAAMRYTECRLTPLARLLLDELAFGTVDLIPNYDGAFREPRLLPARLPLVLLNGASGIGVGMATEIPSHNLSEIGNAVVALLKNPELTLAELLNLIPGPDFPGGAQIISSAVEIAEVYSSGRGSLKTRARWTIEQLARGQWRVVVSELPPGVSAREVLEDLEKCTNPKLREGKKSLSPEQLQLKNVMLTALDQVRDESDKSAPVRLVFEPRSSRQDQEEFVRLLLVHTHLESSVALNLVMLGRDGSPRQKNLLQILQEWIDFRYQTLVRRCRHQLETVQRRLHVLEGRQLVLLNIDEVIQTIRTAEDPKAELSARFGLSPLQAEDILEIRLRQLARLEAIRIEQELDSLRADQGGLQRLLESRVAQTRQLCKEVDADVKRHGDQRRTLIQAHDPVTAVRAVADEPVTIALSRHGWIRSRPGHQLDHGQFGYKPGDQALVVLELRTPHLVGILDTQGRIYTVRAADIPRGRGEGIPLTTLLDFGTGAGLAQAWAVVPHTRYLIAGSGGTGFVVESEAMETRMRAGKSFLVLGPGEEPLAPAQLHPQYTHVATLSERGRLLVFPLTEVRVLPRGKGVILMGLEPGEKLLAVLPVSLAGLEVHGNLRNGSNTTLTLRARELLRYVLGRARKGQGLGQRMIPTRLGNLPE